MTKTQFLSGKKFYHAGNTYKYFPSQTTLFSEKSIGNICRLHNDVYIPIYSILSVYTTHFTAFMITIDDKVVEIKCFFSKLNS